MPQRSDRRTILVVDDDPDIVEVFRHRLELEGFTVETAMDGAAGLEAILTIFPDLVLLDVEMPIMNGLEVLRILVQLGHGVPVIVMSAVL